MGLKRAGLFILIVSFSCSVRPPAVERDTSFAGRGEMMLEEVKEYADLKHYRELRKVGKQYLEEFAMAPGADEVRILLGTADIELGFFDEARSVLEPLADHAAESPLRGHALILLAEVDRSKGLYPASAGRLLEALSTDLESQRRRDALEVLSDVSTLLSWQQLDRLEIEHASSPGIGIILNASLAFSKAVNDTAAVRRLTAKLSEIDLKMAHPEPYVAETVEPIFTKVPGRSSRYRIGLLCPLSGRFAAIGEAFLRGASLALKEARRGGLVDIELVVADSRANPLGAREAAERLVTDEHVGALIGGVLSTSTIAAAQVANFEETVLLSPVATEAGIAEIGEWIFQTTDNAEAEVVAVARLVCDDLGLVRIAFLAADDIRFRDIERLFSAEVRRSGGELTISEFYAEGSTDYKEHIERIRASDPEALFIASDTDDLILILPQLSFYEFGTQLLGTSGWNSGRLLRMVGRDMEGAIFPAVVRSRIDEELYKAAAALTGEPVGDINPFILGGYKGVRTVLEAMKRSGEGGEALRNELARLLDNRRHPFLELYLGRGIPFYRVVNERLEEYTILRVNP
ncbi:MAG: ABC transporter substrate-binding protein [bacterium]|nr:MAG: ABC transporter substrate-binding protein [bacterium]